jgi:hypothetical protein
MSAPESFETPQGPSQTTTWIGGRSTRGNACSRPVLIGRAACPGNTPALCPPPPLPSLFIAPSPSSPGDSSAREPPDPFPNSSVKPRRAYDRVRSLTLKSGIARHLIPKKPASITLKRAFCGYGANLKKRIRCERVPPEVAGFPPHTGNEVPSRWPAWDHARRPGWFVV